jgi:hypothetical protein
MIAVNRPDENQQVSMKSKIMHLTQRDVAPIIDNNQAFINETITPKMIECYPAENGSHQTCVLVNQYGENSVVSNINFINQQVSNAIINVYRHPSGVIKTRMDFKDPPVCEIFGVLPFLNLKCTDAMKKNSPTQF